MSPEQIRGEPLGPASEIFSLGAVLYEMVTGFKPFTGPTDVAVTHAIIHKRPVRIRKLSPRTPRGLVRVIMKCLRKKPERREMTTLQFPSTLRALLQRKASEPPLSFLWQQPFSWVLPSGRRTGYGVLSCP